MSVLTLVRHGQASYMAADYDRLSPVGEEQARKLGQYWVRHGLSFDRAYHGPAKRHRQTAEIAGEVVKTAGMPWPEPEEIPALDEFDAYTMMKLLTPVLAETDEEIRSLNEDFWANQHTPEAGRLLQKLFEAVTRRWCTGEFAVPEIESWQNFQQRVGGVIEDLRKVSTNGTRTVAFTSAGPIAAALAHSLDLAPRRAVEFVWMSRNCSYAQFLSSPERLTLHAFNAIPHLDDLSLLTYR